MRSQKPIDPEKLKVPAFMRKSAIVSQARQKLLLTALDRKEAGVKPGSKVIMAPLKKNHGQAIIDHAMGSFQDNKAGSRIRNHTRSEPVSPLTEIKPALRYRDKTQSGINHTINRLLNDARSIPRSSYAIDPSAAHGQRVDNEAYKVTIPQQPTSSGAQHSSYLRRKRQADLQRSMQVEPVKASKSIEDMETEERETNLFSGPRRFLAIGTVTHYLEKIGVAIIKLNATVRVGEMVMIQGEKYIFSQSVEEMQIDRKPVIVAKKGSHIGLKTAYAAHIGGTVYAVE